MQQQPQKPRQWGWQQQQGDDELGLVTPSKRISTTGIVTTTAPPRGPGHTPV